MSDNASKKSVWIVNPFDTLPAEGHRPLRYWLMAQAFRRAGWSVVCWTTDFNHATKTLRKPGTVPAASAQPPGTVPTLSDGVWDGISVRFVHEPPYFRNVGLRRIWSHWRWAKNWRRAAEGDCPHCCGDSSRSAGGDCPCPPDLIVVSSPPLYICREVREFARKVGARVIVDVMDAWPETFERVAPRWALWPLRRLAGANYLGADAITAVADGYVDLVRTYGFRGVVRRFYHGISLGTVPVSMGTVPGDEDGFSAKNDKKPEIRVVYAGNLGRTYDLQTAIEAVGMLENVTLAIAGKGEQEDCLSKYGDSPRRPGDSPRKVLFAGYLSADALSDFLAKGDIGLVPMRPDSCVGIPYKMADYTRAGLAVASSLGGESDRLLAKYGAGAPYRAGDPKSLADAIRRLVPRLAEARRAARRLAENEFGAEKIYSEFVAFASQVTNK